MSEDRQRSDGGLGKDREWQQQYLDLARPYFPDASLRLIEHQGGCSVTMLVSPTATGEERYIAQLRPAAHAVSISIAAEARRIYGSIVPTLTQLGQPRLEGGSWQLLSMPCVSGTPYSVLMPRMQSVTGSACSRVLTLIDDLTVVLARAWHFPKPQATCTGRVGLPIISRLSQLSLELPESSLREVAQRTLTRVQDGELANLPIVLNHGDLLPSNLLVDPATGHLTGLIDWAEAEWLPFGTCFYGIDHLLGYVNEESHAFVYFEQASILKRRFWSSLISLLPELRQDNTYRSIQLSRTLGILLWHGFAWDDGRIDRVINAKDDPDELARLKAFLLTDFEPKPFARL